MQDSGGKRIELGFTNSTCREDPPKMEVEVEVLQCSSFLFLNSCCFVFI